MLPPISKLTSGDPKVKELPGPFSFPSSCFTILLRLISTTEVNSNVQLDFNVPAHDETLGDAVWKATHGGESLMHLVAC